MSRLQRLLQEVHRRSLWQLLASYIVGAWLVLQIAETLASLIGLPLWFGAGVIVLLAFGLVLVLTTGLVQVVAAYRSDPDRSYSGLRRLFSWKNALIAGVVALAVLVAGTGGYMGLRAMGIGPMGSLVAKGVIQPRERIVLADIEDNANDPVLALTATVAFRTDLSQSRTLRLAERDYIGAVLSRMRREPGTPIDYELAREIAVREGLKAVLAGEVVGRAGTGYVLSVRLVTAETGEVVVAYRESARDTAEFIAAIDRLSGRLRERAGESLRAIRSNPSLAQVTTASLEALKKYSQAEQAQREDRGYSKQVTLLEEAIALDPSFAAAHRRLAAIYGSTAKRSLAVEAAMKAYEHRDRLTELERYNTIATYHYNVSGDQSAWLHALRMVVELSDSTDVIGLNNLGLAYGCQGERELAEALYRRVLELGNATDNAYYNLFVTQIFNGKLDDAEVTLNEYERTIPGCSAHYWRGSLTYLRGDIAETEEQVRAWRKCREAEGNGRPAAAGEGIVLARLRAVQGRLAEAEALATAARAGYEGLEDMMQFRSTVLFLGLLDIVYRGRDEQGVRRIERFLNEYPIDSLDPLDRPYLSLTMFYSVAQRPEQARAFLRQYEAAVDEQVRGITEWFNYRNAKGVLAMAEDRPRDAIAELRLALNCAVHYQTWPWLASAYDRAGVADSAIAFYEQYVLKPAYGRWRFDMHSRWNSLGDPLWLPAIYERLGSLYEQRGDTAKAIYYYGKLVHLWKEADPELQPRVEAARRAMEALSTDR